MVTSVNMYKALRGMPNAYRKHYHGYYFVAKNNIKIPFRNSL